MNLYDHIAPSVHGAGGLTLLEIIPHTNMQNIQGYAQIFIVALTTIFQIVTLLKKKKNVGAKS